MNKPPPSRHPYNVAALATAAAIIAALAGLVWFELSPAGAADVTIGERIEPGRYTLTPAPATSPTTGPTTSPAAPHRRVLGVNLTTANSSSREYPFKNWMRQARAPGTVAHPYNGLGPVTADGQPAGDGGTIVIADASRIGGEYVFVCEGRATIRVNPGTVRASAFDTAANRTTADISLPERDAPMTVAVTWSGTTNGIRNPAFYPVRYAPARAPPTSGPTTRPADSLFTDEFIESIRTAGALRFMDWLGTNDAARTTWDTRARLDAWRWADGVPYEVCFALMRETGKPGWVNVPALADDEHLRQLGQLYRETFPPGRSGPPLYIEFSNETWNGQFKQFAQNVDAAVAEAIAGDVSLNRGDRWGTGESNRFYAGWRRTAKQSVRLKALAGAGDDRVRVVLASHLGYAPPGRVVQEQLEYLAKFHGGAARHIYAIASAPYWTLGEDETAAPDASGRRPKFTERADLTAEMIVNRAGARAAVANTGDAVRAFHALAAAHGVRHFGYEGGLDLNQFDRSVAAKVAAQLDERMRGHTAAYLAAWFDDPRAGDFYYFAHAARSSVKGYWGLAEDARAWGAYPKARGYDDVAARVAAERN